MTTVTSTGYAVGSGGSISLLSRASQSFIYVSSDNRINIWDTNTRKQKRSFVEKNHLNHVYTCCQWRQDKQGSLGVLAVGCSDGAVVLWDLNRGIVTQSIKLATELAVSSIQFANDGASIYVSSSDNYISVFRVSDGELLKSIKFGKKGISKMTLNPRVEVLAVANNSIKLIDVETGRKKKLEAEFNGGVTSMEFSSCGCYLVACSNSSREVLVFDVQATAASSTPLVTIPVSGIPAHLQAITDVTDSDEVRLTISVVYEGRDGCVMRFSPNSNGVATNGNGKRGSEHVQASFEIESCAISSKKSQLHTSCFGRIGELSENGISFACGSVTNPLFVHTQFVSSETQRLLPSITVGSNKTEAAEAGASASEGLAVDSMADSIAPVVLGPLEAGPVKKTKMDGNGDIEKYLTVDGAKKHAGTELGLASVDELTLEQRLEILSSSAAAEEGLESSKLLTNANAKPTSDSLVTLIEQALQVNDDSLLEECLACEEAAVVESTVSRLASYRVVPFLKKLVAKFEKRPSRSGLLTHWLSSILRIHSSFLVSCPDLSAQLAGLSQILDQRLLSYSRLASLGGRLDLLMQQVTSNSVNQNSMVTDSNRQIPKLVYKDL